MPRRPGELSVRSPLVSPRRPPVPGAEQDRQGVQPFAGTSADFPIPPEQDEALLARYEEWRVRWNGSLPEFLTFEYLTIRRQQIPNVDFVFQHPVFGGRTRFGGYILDFFLQRRLEGWRVNGERFHLEKPEDRARDAIMKAQLSSQGIRVIDLWEDDLMQRRDFVLDLAWTQSVSVKSKAPFGSSSGG